MKIQLRLFARAKELAQTDVLRLELPADATIGDLRRQVAEAYPHLKNLLERSALAVHDEFAEDTLVLSADAEVALLPPVSGG